MEHVTSSQAWGVSGGVPAGVIIALKNGFSIINGWQINSMGWVNGQGRDYLMAVLTDLNPTEGYGIQTINDMSSIVWMASVPECSGHPLSSPPTQGLKNLHPK